MVENSHESEDDDDSESVMLYLVNITGNRSGLFQTSPEAQLLLDEDPDDYEMIRQYYFHDLKPIGLSQVEDVEAIVMAYWRLLRVIKMKEELCQDTDEKYYLMATGMGESELSRKIESNLKSLKILERMEQTKQRELDTMVRDYQRSKKAKVRLHLRAFTAEVEEIAQNIIAYIDTSRPLAWRLL